MERYDYIAIGGGSAGIASANRAAEYGARALIVEAVDVGGTCVNRGCVPKKIMWYGAQVHEAISLYGKDYGFTPENVAFDFSTLRANREAYIDRVHNSYISGFKSRKTEFIQGFATFKEPHIIEVNGQEIYGEHIAIVTGGRPAELNIPGQEHAGDSDSFFEWEALPKSVIMIGAGYIAVEIAGVLNALGVQTDLCVRKESPLRSFDKDIVDALVEEMENSGLNLHTHHVPKEIQANEDGTYTVFFENGKSLTAEKILQAIGRVPNTHNIGIESTGVKLDQNGYIVVNEFEETSVAGLYAFGDITGKIELTPVAIKAGRQLSERLFNNKPNAKMDYEFVPSVVFAHPAIGTCGLTEAAAIATYGEENIKVYKSRFASMYTAVTAHRQVTLVKLVCLGEEERVIGLHGIGYGVDEMIQGFAVAIKMGATKEDFDATVAIHPTGAEEFVTMR